MMETAKLQPVAEALKLFGDHGVLVVKFSLHAHTFFNETEPLFAIIDGIAVPFFISTLQYRGKDRAHILFEYIYREEQAKELIGKTLYQFPPTKKRNVGADLHVRPHLKGAFAKAGTALIGFTVSDVEKGPLGHVDAFIDWEMNPCLSIQPTHSDQTFLVPFHQALINHIDLKAKHITLFLPEGLLDI